MQVILTSYNNIKARQTTAAIESRTITTKAGNGVIIENGYNEAADDYGLEIL